MSYFEVEPLVGAMGARIHGVDLRDPPEGEALAELRRVWLERLVLVFPGQELTPDQQIAAAARIGRPCINPFVAGLETHPVVIPIIKEPHDVLSFGSGWHTDQTFESVPPMASLLYLKEVPPQGGDTLWSDQYQAYEALSPAMRTLLEGLVALHDASDSYGPKGEYGTSEAHKHSMKILVSKEAEVAARHPVVCRHPETGRPFLFVNQVFTKRLEGFSEAEGRALLGFLFRHQQDSTFVFRHRWTAGDVALWDNRCTQHHALNDYQGFRRAAYRVTIANDPAAWSQVWEGKPIAA